MSAAKADIVAHDLVKLLLEVKNSFALPVVMQGEDGHLDLFWVVNKDAKGIFPTNTSSILLARFRHIIQISNRKTQGHKRSDQRPLMCVADASDGNSLGRETKIYYY